jgi:hypothetical protein
VSLLAVIFAAKVPRWTSPLQMVSSRYHGMMSRQLLFASSRPEARFKIRNGKLTEIRGSFCMMAEARYRRMA